ncbi:MAG: trypsin-like peptidase domain-containing protein [Thermoguttaceae bacterium]|nr:trypsin-like peptidase domain-containing protein [Thermoguttaceae bacterium]MDW8079079.1 trypsin-like peptidase domain-containing protein [Thermoguttaceae bacterium]
MPEFDPLLNWLGIPPDRRPVDYYSLLGLRRFEDDKLLILQAVQVRQLAIQPHLRGPHAKEAEEILAILAQAQSCLLDPKRKAAYDEQLRQRMAGGPTKEGVPDSQGAGGPAATAPGSQVAASSLSPQSTGAASAAESAASEEEYALKDYPAAEPGREFRSASQPASDHLKKQREEEKRDADGGRHRLFPTIAEKWEDYIKLGVVAAVAVGGIALIGLLIHRLSLDKAVARKPGPPAPAQAGGDSALIPAAERLSAGPSRGGSDPVPGSQLREVEPEAKAVPSKRSGDQPPPAVFLGGPVPAAGGGGVGGIPQPARAAPEKPGPAAGDTSQREQPEPVSPLPQPAVQPAEPPAVEELIQDRSIELPEPLITDRKTAEVFLRANGASTKTRLDALGNDVRFALEMLLLYKVFLEWEGVTEAEKEKARDHLPVWEKRAANKMVRLGEQWVVPEDWKARKKDARAAFKKGLLLVGRSDQAAINEFEKASRLDPEFVSADFLLGLLYAVAGPKFHDARQCFRRCVQRKPDHLGAWNNLALTELRNRAPASALSAFRKALELGGSPEVTHNIKVVLLADNSKVLPLSPATSRSFAELYTRACELAPEAGGGGGGTPRGFIFLPLSWDLLIADGLFEPALPVRGPRPAVARKEELRVVGFGSGFVVAPNYIVTNRRVVEKGTLFGIIPHKDRKPVAYAEVAFLPDDPNVDLALLYCENWSGQPMPIRTEENYLPAGSEVALLGFPVPELLGAEIKVTRGIISAPPEPGDGKLSHQYLIALRSNPGNSGGPFVDTSGTVVAVPVDRFGFLGMNFAVAEPADKLVDLLEQALPDVTLRRGLEISRELPEIVKDAEKSVVLIQCLAKPVSFGTGGQRSGLGWLDTWCLRCNGEGWVDCPNERCGNGSISTTRERVLGHDPMTGRPIIVREPTTVPCLDCGARGNVSCPVCGGSRRMR